MSGGEAGERPVVSWLADVEDSGFGLGHLPWGIVSPPGSDPRVALRVGEHALDLLALARGGLLRDVAGLDAAALAAPALNLLIDQGPAVWTALRARARALLEAGCDELRRAPGGLAERALLPLDAIELRLPVAVGDYVDFYSSLHHANNTARILRPANPTVPASWRHIPLGYHGRAGTVVVSGTAVERPLGVRASAAGEAPEYAAERRLDAELELGFVLAGGPPRGTPIAVGDSARHLFGVVLLADWSAREIQVFESAPLGPFVSKAFATSIAAWVTPLAALEPLRVAGVAQDPPAPPHLRTAEPWALDLELEFALRTGAGANARASTLSRVSAAEGLYWTAPQQLAHLTSGGISVRSGDLMGTGTISGPSPATQGCLLELTDNGRSPIELAGGVRRGYLEDGDEIIMSGGGRLPGGERLTLGEVRGCVRPARSA